MAAKVKIEPQFGDENAEGEFDEEAYGLAEEAFQSALEAYIKTGARAENVEDAIVNGLADSFGI